MKLINVVLNMLSMTGLASCIGLNTCPIQMSTNKITFSEHSNSGLLVSTTFEIYEDSLVWKRMEPRYGWKLRDVLDCDRQDFNELLTALSTIRFSAKDAHDHSAGGSGWGVSFENQKGRYLQYNSMFKLSGDYERVNEKISEYVERHKPKGLILFDQLRAEPHEPGMYGDFDELPDTLKTYLVND
jgi:hypothetical protein